MIEPMLVLSTAHLTEQTCNEFLRDCPWACYEKGINEPVGWFMYVPEDTSGAPEDLLRCINRAKAQCCSWIMFDRDAAEEDDLPSYDW